MNRTFEVFHAIKYATIVYDGINYIIEYDVGDGKTVQINIHVPLAYKDSKPKIVEMIDDGKKVKSADGFKVIWRIGLCTILFAVS